MAANGTDSTNVYSVEYAQKRITLPTSRKLVIGSAVSSDFIILSPKVSNQHCEIAFTEDGWMLNNLSPEGTAVVGKAILRNGNVGLDNGGILRMGGNYIQCKWDNEAAQPQNEANQAPMKILNINYLMGEVGATKCYLAGHRENQADESGEIGDTNSTDNTTPEISAENRVSDQMHGEINGLINSMATEHTHMSLELVLKNKALKKAIMESRNLEVIAAEMQEQLRYHEQNGLSKDAVNEIMESELHCSICEELMIDATTLGCSHSFCAHCLTTWKSTKAYCPLCRNPIVHECKTRIIDSFIEKLVSKLSEEIQNRRKELLDSRRRGVS